MTGVSVGVDTELDLLDFEQSKRRLVFPKYVQLQIFCYNCFGLGDPQICGKNLFRSKIFNLHWQTLQPESRERIVNVCTYVYYSMTTQTKRFVLFHSKDRKHVRNSPLTPPITTALKMRTANH